MVANWPYSRWRRYRAYYRWWRDEEYRLHGWTPKEKDDGKPRWWVEQGGDTPFTGKAWGDERAEVPR